MDQFKGFLSALLTNMRSVDRNPQLISNMATTELSTSGLSTSGLSPLGRFYASDIFDRNVLSVIHMFTRRIPDRVDLKDETVYFPDCIIHIPRYGNFMYIEYDETSILVTAVIITKFLQGNDSDLANYVRDITVTGVTDYVAEQGNTDAKYIVIDGNMQAIRKAIRDAVARNLPHGKSSFVTIRLLVNTVPFLVRHKLVPAIKVVFEQDEIFYHRVFQVDKSLYCGYARYRIPSPLIVKESRCVLYSKTAENPPPISEMQDTFRMLLGTTHSIKSVNVLGKSVTELSPIVLDEMRRELLQAPSAYTHRFPGKHNLLYGTIQSHTILQELVARSIQAVEKIPSYELVERLSSAFRSVCLGDMNKYRLGYLRAFTELFSDIQITLHLEQLPQCNLEELQKELSVLYNTINEPYDEKKHNSSSLRGTALLNDTLFISDLNWRHDQRLRFVIEVNPLDHSYILTNIPTNFNRCSKPSCNKSCCEYKCCICRTTHAYPEYRKYICTVCNRVLQGKECLQAHYNTTCLIYKWCVVCDKAVDHDTLHVLYGHSHKRK